MQIHDKKPNLLQIFFNSPMYVLRQVCISICSHGGTLPFLGMMFNDEWRTQVPFNTLILNQQEIFNQQNNLMSSLFEDIRKEN